MTSVIDVLEQSAEQVAVAFEPPPRQTVSEWAGQNRRLSSEASAEAGEWRTDRAPYQRAIMDALTPNSPYERVVVMAASQTGKTDRLSTLPGRQEIRFDQRDSYLPDRQFRRRKIRPR